MIFGSFHTGQSLAKSQQDKFYTLKNVDAFTNIGNAQCQYALTSDSTTPTVDWATYRLQYSTLNTRIGCSAGTSNATTATVVIPFSVLNYPVGVMLAINAGTILATPAKWSGTPGSSTLTLYKDTANAAWTNSGAKSFLIENMVTPI